MDELQKSSLPLAEKEVEPTLHLLGEFLTSETDRHREQAVDGFRRLIDVTLNYGEALPADIDNARDNPTFSDFDSLFRIYQQLHRHTLLSPSDDPNDPDTPFDKSSLHTSMDLARKLALDRYGIQLVDWQFGHRMGLSLTEDKRSSGVRRCPRFERLSKREGEGLTMSQHEISLTITVFRELFNGTFADRFLNEPLFADSYAMSVSRYALPAINRLEALFPETIRMEPEIRQYIARLAGIGLPLVYSHLSHNEFLTPNQLKNLQAVVQAAEEGRIAIFNPQSYCRITGTRLNKEAIHDLFKALQRRGSENGVYDAPTLGKMIGVNPKVMERVSQLGNPAKTISYAAVAALEELVSHEPEGSPAHEIVDRLTDDPLTYPICVKRDVLIELTELFLSHKIIRDVHFLSLCIGIPQKILEAAMDPKKEPLSYISTLAMHQLYGLVYLHRPKGGIPPVLPAEQYRKAQLLLSRLQIPRPSCQIPIGKKQNVEFAVSDDVFVPTGEGADREKTSRLNEFATPRAILPRTELVLQLLQSMGVDFNQCSFIQGNIATGSSRRMPYRAVIVPSHKVMILICDEEGNRTFVISGEEGLLPLATLSKAGLETRGSSLIWVNDLGVWQRRLRAMIECTPMPNNMLPMDRAYFTNREIVEADLQAFAKVAQKNPSDLSQVDMVRHTITCSSGKTIPGHQYLNRAGVALGFGQQQKDVQGKRAEILTRLKRIAGIHAPEYPVMNAIYFEQNLKADLERAAAAIRQKLIMNGEIGAEAPFGISDLTINHLNDLESFECVHREPVSGKTYLLRAGVALGLAANQKQAEGRQGLILKELKRRSGVEITIYPKMDAAYFSADRVRNDLTAFAMAAAAHKGRSIVVETMTTKDMMDVEAPCQNGEAVTGVAYLHRAKRALRIGHPEKADRVLTLNHLKSIAA